MKNMFFRATWALLGCLLFAGTASAQSTDGLDRQAHEPQGKFFSVRLPSGWQKSEMDQMKEFNKYELKAYAPGFEGLGYLMIALDYYAEPSRSAERFIYDVQHPEFGNPEENPVDRTDIAMLGKKAVALTMKLTRTLIGTEKRVPCERRYVVCPAEVGFFVLTLDAPAAQFKKFLPSFDAVLATFKQEVVNNQAITANTDGTVLMPEVSADDYAVYTDFLQTGKLTGTELPPYFEDVLREDGVYDRTSLRDDWKTLSKSKVISELGPGVSELVADFQKKNTKESLVKDKIYLSRIRIQPQRRFSLSRGLSENPLSGRSSYLAFSRVGFNASKTLALLYVGHASNPITSYFVVMEKKDTRWVVKNITMDQMLIQ